MKQLTVVKFGGSLIDFTGKNIPRIVKIITDLKQKDGLGPVSVFSSPNTVTDSLIAKGEAATHQKIRDIPEIFTGYKTLAKQYVDPTFNEPLSEELTYYWNMVREALTSINKRFNGYIKAKLLANGGELPTSALMNYILQSNGLPSTHLNRESWPIITDDNFEDANPSFEQSTHRVHHMVKLLDDGEVIVHGGFIGYTNDGLETLLGRGGSDFTAIFDAILLKNKFDVSSLLIKETPVYSADPSIVKDQTLFRIPSLTYNEASKATVTGMKIVQNAAVRKAKEYHLPITVAPLNDIRSKTIIETENDSDRIVKCVTGIKGCAIVTMDNTSSRSFEDCLRLWEGFDTFLDLGTEALENGQVIRDFLLLNSDFVRRYELQIKQFDSNVKIRYGVGVVTLIGDQMKESPGIASVALGSIPHINIIRGVFAPHTSQIILSINEDDLPEAMNAIHANIQRINKR